jgi:hypothetical protein
VLLSSQASRDFSCNREPEHLSPAQLRAKPPSITTSFLPPLDALASASAALATKCREPTPQFNKIQQLKKLHSLPARVLVGSISSVSANHTSSSNSIDLDESVSETILLV